MGVYLVVQTEVVAGYEPFASFLVTIPIKDGQTWNYDVDASPKMELIPKKDIVPPPDTETPDTEVPDTEVPDTEVPDTEVPNTEDTEGVADSGACFYRTCVDFSRKKMER